MKEVLFVCIHNAGRSQMAEGFFNHLAQGKATSESAGTKPAREISPTVIAAMSEVGIDIRNQHPKPLTLEMLEKADRVITMGCQAAEVCPASFVTTEEWQLSDPKGAPIEEVRRIRDQIKAKVESLIKELK
ncbi:MAG: arsenate reductase ArsC [Dehalococcoidales bacterium]|nr:arsenate reductase ArsC [Dehalococcoidales bacterium]